MNGNITSKNFTGNSFTLFDETFETQHGAYLDKGDSLFETLQAISAERASIPVGGKCASLAAQVAHVTFYLEVLERALLKQPGGKNDWGLIWRSIEHVNAAEWDAIVSNLKQTYTRVVAEMHAISDWDNDDIVGAAMAMLVHSAYHLGEIRQALCVI